MEMIPIFRLCEIIKNMVQILFYIVKLHVLRVVFLCSRVNTVK